MNEISVLASKRNALACQNNYFFVYLANAVLKKL